MVTEAPASSFLASDCSAFFAPPLRALPLAPKGSVIVAGRPGSLKAMVVADDETAR